MTRPDGLACCDEQADVHAVGSQGATALIFSALKGHTTCVRQLLDAKAGVTVDVPGFGTALSIAKTRGHQSCVELLEKA